VNVLKGLCSVTLAAMALAGCKTVQKPGQGEVEQQLSSLMGADISASIAILGFPDARKDAPHDQRTYVWSSDRAANLPQPEIRMGAYGTHPEQSPPQDTPCTVELTADSSGRIVGYQWSGTDNRCSWVLQAFLRAEHTDQRR
jgi:hypothetical protein